MAGRLNLEFDSRVLRTSMGAGGMTKPVVTPNGGLTKISCLNCGRPAGAVSSSIPPALRGHPGVIFVCEPCEAKVGSLPAQAISFERYRQ